MTLRSIHNRRNFFSDYWLGTLLAARGLAGPRLSKGELRKRLRRFVRLVEALGGTSRVEPARFRERFARPLLNDVFDFTLLDEGPASHVHGLTAHSTADPASPVTLVYLCHDASDIDARDVRHAVDSSLDSTGLHHGLILTPEVLRLVRRAGDGPRNAALDVALVTLRELDDEDSLQAAYRLLSARSFAPDSNNVRPIDALERESREHSAKVSSELKGAVFEAAESLVSAFQRDIAARVQDFAETQPSLTTIRDAGFLALYRVLFILYAESRDERLARHRVYQGSYSLEDLIGKLLTIPRTSLAENRTTIWERLRVLFRVFDEGLAPNLPNLENIPPRGGRLFSSTTAEGELLMKLQLGDYTCARVLLAIATTKPRRGVGRERVSFRELEIEQLGSVYEGLLEYEPAVADQLRLDVNVGGRRLVLKPDELAELCELKRLVLKGDESLVVGTAAEQLHSANIDDVNSEEDDDEIDEEEDDDEDDDEALTVRAGKPVRLVRRLEPGEFYFRAGGARKASGSYYTPTPMVDFIVREAVSPLAADRTSAEIQQLRIIDLACGSAHFLVGAARFLGARLHEAFRSELGDNPPAVFVPLGGSATAMRERWAEEGAAWCKRRIVERCLYGVDLNPAAVQLAQVALWIESLAGDRPLSFFAHHIRCGNSLQGTFVANFDSAPDPRLATHRDRTTLELFQSNLRQRIDAALGERRLIDVGLPPEVRPDTPEEFQYKEDRLRRSEAALADARLLMDLRSAAPFVPPIWADLAAIIGQASPEAVARTKTWWSTFETVRSRERFFHWELEFPEVMLREDRPGFDVVLGNPPWDKVLPNKREFYADVDPLVVVFKGAEFAERIARLHRAHAGLSDRYDSERERTTTFARVLRKGGDFPLAKPEAEEDEEGGLLRQRLRSDQSAHEDLSKYFVDRSLRLARAAGSVGLVVPSVLYSGDGCVGIRQFLLRDARITAFYGFENRRRIFPIHAMYKFANLAARVGAEGAGAFDAAFMRQDVNELETKGPKPWMVRVTRDELERLSPETLAFLEYRGPRDQDIVRRMSAGRPTLGGSGPGAWGTRLISWRQHEIIFNAKEDKDLFTIPGTTRLHSPESVLGADVPRDPQALLPTMRASGYWPVYEGKHIEQYLVGVKPVRWWLSVSQASAKYGRQPREAPTLVFRETASNTNQRTCIAAVLPAQAAASHKLTGVNLQHVTPAAALTVLNSMCFDFLLRLRSAGTNVSFTYIRPVAVPPASVVQSLSQIATRFAPVAGIRHLAEDEQAWPALWDAERGVAEAYGVGPEEFAHILASFPVWLRKRAALGEFYRARLEEWRAEI